MEVYVTKLNSRSQTLTQEHTKLMNYLTEAQQPPQVKPKYLCVKELCYLQK